MRPPVRRLVLAEKFSAARRLAQILSQGKTETVRAEGFSYFQFSRAGDHVIIFPLRGHVVEIDYPAEAHDWKDTDLDVLIDMEPIRHESPPALHDTLRRLAEGTDEVVLATDYDREGELIGVEALETLRGQRPDLPARRARFSATSPSEASEARPQPWNASHKANIGSLRQRRSTRPPSSRRPPAKASAPPAECSRLRICTSMEKSAIRERTTRCIPLPFPSMKSLDGCANRPMAPTRRGCLPSPHWNPAEVQFRRRTIRRCTRPPLLRSGGTAAGLRCTTWPRADSSRRSPPRA